MEGWFGMKKVVVIGTGAQGFNKEYGRLWGVFGDPNVIAYISIVSVFASVYFMFVYKKVWAYIIYGLNIFFQMSFIVLSLSRSGVLILLTVPIIIWAVNYPIRITKYSSK